ncbi:MAG TPA: hypothetical protein VGG68_00745 [Caulobacteraceae bacterium]|jgi:hypothetical protein
MADDLDTQPIEIIDADVQLVVEVDVNGPPVVLVDVETPQGIPGPQGPQGVVGPVGPVGPIGPMGGLQVIVASHDTTGATDTPAILAALNAGKEVVLQGAYYLNAGVTIPPGAAIDGGGGFLPGLTPAGTILYFTNAVPTLVTVGGNVSGGPGGLRGISVVRQGSGAPAGSVGVFVQDASNANVVDVLSLNSAMCWAFRRDSGAAGGIQATCSRLYSGNPGDVHVQIDGWSELRFSDCTFGFPGSASAGNAYVRLTGNGTVIPFDIEMSNCRFSGSPPLYFMRMVNLVGAGSITELKLDRCHVEGVGTAMFSSDATVVLIERFTITDCTLIGTSQPMWALNAATQIMRANFKGTQFFGNDFSLAPTPAFVAVSMVGNFIFSPGNLTIPAGSTITLIGNTWNGNLTVTGAGSLVTCGDNFTTGQLVNNGTGTVTTVGLNGLWSGQSVNVMGPATGNRAFNILTGVSPGSASTRWAMLANNTAETGAAAGSNFLLARYDDTGAYVDSPLSIVRSTGNVSIAHGLTVSGALTVAGNTALNGALTVSGLSAISGAAGTQRNLAFQTAGSTRWLVFANTTAESGGNVGSDFFIQRCNDAGVAIDNPFVITRSNGAVGISTTLAVGGTIAGSGFYINGAAATTRQITFQTAAVARWRVIVDSSAESGNNIGSNFYIQSQTDAGAALTNVVFINRATGLVTIGGGSMLVSNSGAGPATLAISAPAGQQRDLFWQTAGSTRWVAYCTQTAEGGANAGSDFSVGRYDDTGVFINPVLTLTRSTGAALFNNSLQVNGGALYINGGAASNRGLWYQSSGVARWLVDVTNTAESGSNAGSDFAIYNYSDAGAYISTPLSITRSTGLTTLNFGLNVTGAVEMSGAVDVVGAFTMHTSATLYAGSPLYLTAPAGTGRAIYFQTSGATRWTVTADGAAESGSNIGTNFVINRYNDAGTFVDQPFTIQRATGMVTLNNGLTVNGSNPAVGADIYLNTPTPFGRNLWFQTNGVNRWAIYCDNSAESGSNAGSLLQINNFSDTGASLGTPFGIHRDTGMVYINNGLTLAGPTSAPNPGIYDTTQSIATMATVTQRGMTAGVPVIHQSGADAYPDLGWTGRLIMMQTANSIFLPGSAAGSQATIIVTNTSSGAVGIAGANLGTLQAGDGAILVGDGAGGFHCVGMFTKAGHLTSMQADDYAITEDDGEVHFTADATVTIPDDLAHVVEVSCDPGVTVTFASKRTLRSVPRNRVGRLSMIGPAEATLRRKGEEVWVRGDVA